MDSKMSLSPLPPTASFTASTPRKRSINEVEDASLPSVGPKRAFTELNGDNQENRDPTPTPPKVDAALSMRQTVVLPPPSVIIPMNNSNGEPSPSPVKTKNMDPANATSTSPTADAHTPVKNKTVSPSKDAKQKEKEARERQKQDEKLKKEEEKRAKADEKKKRDAEKEEEKKKRDAEKEEEKKKREAEREEKRKAKEEEKAAKEDEKRRKSEEKLKKERAQPKLNAFFVKPKIPSTSSSTPPVVPSPSQDFPAISPNAGGTSQSDYRQEFPDFFLQSHTTLAPVNRFERDSEALKHVRQTIDDSLAGSINCDNLPFRPSEIFNLIPYKRPPARPRPSVKDILLQIRNMNDNIADPDAMDIDKPSNPHDILRKFPVKSLKFTEDVRPPYQGTFTVNVSQKLTKKIALNPYHQGLPGIDYEYDSEAEWEEPGEGEDLDSEEDEEASDDDEDDMDEFLDDEDDALAVTKQKQRPIVGDLEPQSSGLHWMNNNLDPELEAYCIEPLSNLVRKSIDPFSTAYWKQPKVAKAATKAASKTGKETAKAAKATAKTAKSKATLPKGQQSLNEALKPGGAPSVVEKTVKVKQVKPFPSDKLAEFKGIVNDNVDVSKVGMVELLKARFRGVATNDTLKTTLDQVAKRVGQKEVDKKWVLL